MKRPPTTDPAASATSTPEHTHDTHGPWKTLSSRTVYDNAWIRVEEHDVINPSGGRNVYGKVCFKNRAVGVIAMDADDNIYLVGQTRYTLGRYSWELPMGGAPLAEDPLTAAKRELREETGLSAGRWRELMTVHTTNSVTDELGIVYVAEELVQGQQDLEDTEDLAVKVVSFPEALRLTLDGEITDAISVAAILKLAVERQEAAGPAPAHLDAPAGIDAPQGRSDARKRSDAPRRSYSRRRSDG